MGKKPGKGGNREFRALSSRLGTCQEGPCLVITLFKLARIYITWSQSSKMICTQFIHHEHIRIDTNVCRFNAMALPNEIDSMKSDHVSQEMKNTIQQNINNLIKQFFCAQFSKSSDHKVPTQLQKPETYLLITSIEERVKELKKIKKKEENNSILTDATCCAPFRLELTETGDKGNSTIQTSQMCTPT